MQMLATLKNEKVAIRTAKNQERIATHLKEKQRESDKFDPVAREEKKRKYMSEGKEAARKASGGGRGGKGRKKAKREEDD